MDPDAVIDMQTAWGPYANAACYLLEMSRNLRHAQTRYLAVPSVLTHGEYHDALRKFNHALDVADANPNHFT